MSTPSIDPNTHCENILNGNFTPLRFDGKFKPLSREVLINLRDQHGNGGNLSDFLFIKLICYFPDLLEGKEEDFKQTASLIRGSSDPKLQKQAKKIDSWISQEPTLRRLFSASPLIFDQTP